ncbi:hypothetical protein [Nonomuraea sp. SYSU D8015]|uniref:hypothetical protein n=1 Tax=Nonomuraea sp. SYSU D8015 TaxID=2593644 RepID=UPI001660CC12|nr:hypothetical protein [Nonomuraea sp. SYSU D8015]
MTPLERRYRRLLTSYPKEHRARHEEEMIAVLLAGSSPGQRRPTARDAFDVLRGGLAIRLHRAVKPEARRQWHDAVNLAALIAPIALFIGLLFRAAAYTGRALPAFVREEALQLLELVVFALPYGLVALLAWLGRPRASPCCPSLCAP